MKHSTKLLTVALLISTTVQVNATDYLKKCWEKQARPSQKKVLTFSYQEKSHELGHLLEPWQQTEYSGHGKIWFANELFLKQDTLMNGTRSYYSKTVFGKDALLFLDYGDKDLFAVTKDMFSDQTFKTGRYLPSLLINYFYGKNIPPDKKSNKQFAIHTTTINKTVVSIYIDRATSLVSKITLLSDDEMYGDVVTSYLYSDYQKTGPLNFPATINIERINGKVKDEVKISSAHFTETSPNLLEKPANYAHKEPTEEKPEPKTEKYNDYIYFIELKHTDDKIMVVEFADFLLVAEAPLNSKNGELIISEAAKIAPSKPIKYFVFGHHHPHYLGGIRPFISKGVTVICSDINKDYVQYLAEAKHTLNPDGLELHPRKLEAKLIKDSLNISDGKTEMHIFFIGSKSAHTKDYLIYYFPKEKLLFENDLVWIKREGDIDKASARQAGLYGAIKELGLEVKTIVQSWPVADYGVKTVIPFEDLEKSINVK